MEGNILCKPDCSRPISLLFWMLLFTPSVFKSWNYNQRYFLSGLLMNYLPCTPSLHWKEGHLASVTSVYPLDSAVTVWIQSRTIDKQMGEAVSQKNFICGHWNVSPNTVLLLVWFQQGSWILQVHDYRSLKAMPLLMKLLVFFHSLKSESSPF